jgi:hypothetical protein
MTHAVAIYPIDGSEVLDRLPVCFQIVLRQSHVGDAGDALEGRHLHGFGLDADVGHPCLQDELVNIVRRQQCAVGVQVRSHTYSFTVGGHPVPEDLDYGIVSFAAFSQTQLAQARLPVHRAPSSKITSNATTSMGRS